MYELWDASHTRRQYYSDEDVLADFVPAGWLLEVGRKPVTQLRSIGVESNVPDREPEYYLSES